MLTVWLRGEMQEGAKQTVIDGSETKRRFLCAAKRQRRLRVDSIAVKESLWPEVRTKHPTP